MISKDCKFSDFMGAVRDKDYYEMIHLADREATEAERRLLRRRSGDPLRERCGRQYAERIKQFIEFMRYEARPRVRDPRDAELFEAMRPAKRPLRGI
jgi:hypothetical protein